MTMLKLKFVNNNKPFKLPNWTVGKHKKVLELLNKAEIEEDDKDLYFQYYLIWVGLKDIDNTIEFDMIKNLHPKVVTDLFEAIYNEGKVEIFFRPKNKKHKN